MRLSYPLRKAPRVNQGFGERPEVYSKYKIDDVPLKGHEGIDLDADLGTEVVACDDGFAQEVADQGSVGYGRYIKLIHSWGETVYAHLKSFNIKQGEQVLRGQTIGLADSTGNSTGNHLHLGVRVNPYNRKDGWGGYSDPGPLLFEGESDVGLPKWLINFLAEKQIELGKAEPAIREWWEGWNQNASKDTALQGWQDFKDDLVGIIKPSNTEFSGILEKGAELVDFQKAHSQSDEEFNKFVLKVATVIGSKETVPGKVTNALIKYVSSVTPSNLTGIELIRLGLKKILKRG